MKTAIRAANVRPLGFAPCESSLMMVVDPSALEPYLKSPEILADWYAASLAAFSEGNHEVALGTGGGQAVMMYGTQRGRHVLVKENLGGDDVTLDRDVKDAA